MPHSCSLRPRITGCLATLERQHSRMSEALHQEMFGGVHFCPETVAAGFRVWRRFCANGNIGGLNSGHSRAPFLTPFSVEGALACRQENY